jgi:hypothetical protein
MRGTWCGVWIVAMVWASAALPWAPFTHELLNEQALRELPQNPALSFLQQDTAVSAFITAGSLPDITFDVLAGGKTDREYNDLFHSDGPENSSSFTAHLLKMAQTAGHPEDLAFALGWKAHILADAIGDRSGAVTTRNPLDLPANLSYVSSGLTKILLDGVFATVATQGRDYRPRYRRALVARAVQACQSAHGVTVNPKEVDKKLAQFERRFSRSARILEHFAFLVASNRALVMELQRGPFVHPGGTAVADVPESVKAIRDMLAGVGATPPSTAPAIAKVPDLLDDLPVAPEPAAPAEADSDESVPVRAARLYRTLEYMVPVPVAGAQAMRKSTLEWVAEETVRASAGVIIAALQSRLVGRMDVRRRVMICFCLKLMDRKCRLADLKAAVHRCLH